MEYELITPPAIEPVSLVEAKLHLRVEHAEDDALINGLIKAARQHVEQYLGRPLITQVLGVSLDCFLPVIRLWRQPIQSVDSIVYLDTAGVPQSLDVADYHVDISSEPARIAPGYGKSWPSTRAEHNAVTLQVTAGYGLGAADVPEPVRQAMLLLIGHWYENREAVVIGTISGELPIGVAALLSSYKVMQF